MIVRSGKTLIGGFPVKALFAATLGVLVLAGIAAGTEATVIPPVTYADVLFVVAEEREDGAWLFDVTVRHEDTGWEHYADAWEVLSPDGSMLAKRVLAHPHVGEQPFTRSLSGIEIPPEYEQVLVRAHDLVHGYGGREVIVSLLTETGPGFETRRATLIPRELVAKWVGKAPEVDGVIDPIWETVPPLTVPLDCASWGWAVVTLRAATHRQRLYLLARWPEAAPVATAGVVNKLTLHWNIVPDFIHCSIACHTAYFDAQRELQALNAETIPQAGHESLPAAGGWENGEWTVEWSRPLLSSNPYDLQMSDLTIDYPFRVKVFDHRVNQPDPMSDTVLLRFEPTHASS
jgi:hypothetical protein